MSDQVIDQDVFDNEVDELFMKTQMNKDEEEEDYDKYVPLSVQMESAVWNVLVPSKANETDDSISNDNNEPVSFPISRVRKIMKMDPSVKVVSKQALTVLAKSITLFVDSLAVKTANLMESRGSKQVKGSSIVQICKDSPELQFLLDDLLIENMDTKRVKVTTDKPEKEKEVPTSTNSISTFFNKTKQSTYNCLFD